jgi:hypothetical protein
MEKPAKKLFVMLMSAFATLFGGPSDVSAAAAATFTVPIVNATFSPLCTAVPTSVTLNGQYHFAVHTSQNPDGTYTTKLNSVATGTAIDNTGQSYVFNYVNHEDDITSTPADAPPATVIFSDRFSLLSKGKAPNLKVVFQVAFFVDANDNITSFQLTAIKGDPNCDPI